MEKLKKATVAIAAVLALGLAPSVARANTITVSFVSVVPLGGGLFSWNYQISEDDFGMATPGPAPGRWPRWRPRSRCCRSPTRAWTTCAG